MLRLGWPQAWAQALLALSFTGAALAAAAVAAAEPPVALNPGQFDLEQRSVELNSGYRMPIVGLGTYALSDEECYQAVTALLHNGGRLRP